MTRSPTHAIVQALAHSRREPLHPVRELHIPEPEIAADAASESAPSSPSTARRPAESWPDAVSSEAADGMATEQLEPAGEVQQVSAATADPTAPTIEDMARDVQAVAAAAEEARMQLEMRIKAQQDQVRRQHEAAAAAAAAEAAAAVQRAEAEEAEALRLQQAQQLQKRKMRRPKRESLLPEGQASDAALAMPAAAEQAEEVTYHEFAEQRRNVQRLLRLDSMAHSKRPRSSEGMRDLFQRVNKSNAGAEGQERRPGSADRVLVIAGGLRQAPKIKANEALLRWYKRQLRSSGGTESHRRTAAAADGMSGEEQAVLTVSLLERIGSLRAMRVRGVRGTRRSQLNPGGSPVSERHTENAPSSDEQHSVSDAGSGAADAGAEPSEPDTGSSEGQSDTSGDAAHASSRLRTLPRRQKRRCGRAAGRHARGASGSGTVVVAMPGSKFGHSVVVRPLDILRSRASLPQWTPRSIALAAAEAADGAAGVGVEPADDGADLLTSESEAEAPPDLSALYGDTGYFARDTSQWPPMARALVRDWQAVFASSEQELGLGANTGQVKDSELDQKAKRLAESKRALAPPVVLTPAQRRWGMLRTLVRRRRSDWWLRDRHRRLAVAEAQRLPVLRPDQWLLGAVKYGSPWAYFVAEIPHARSILTLDVHPESGSPDLFVSTLAPPARADYQWMCASSSGCRVQLLPDDRHHRPGRVYVGVHSTLPSQFTVRARVADADPPPSDAIARVGELVSKFERLASGGSLVGKTAAASSTMFSVAPLAGTTSTGPAAATPAVEATKVTASNEVRGSCETAAAPAATSLAEVPGFADGPASGAAGPDTALDSSEQQEVEQRSTTTELPLPAVSNVSPAALPITSTAVPASEPAGAWPGVLDSLHAEAAGVCASPRLPPPALGDELGSLDEEAAAFVAGHAVEGESPAVLPSPSTPIPSPRALVQPRMLSIEDVEPRPLQQRQRRVQLAVPELDAQASTAPAVPALIVQRAAAAHPIPPAILRSPAPAAYALYRAVDTAVSHIVPALKRSPSRRSPVVRMPAAERRRITTAFARAQHAQQRPGAEPSTSVRVSASGFLFNGPSPAGSNLDAAPLRGSSSVDALASRQAADASDKRWLPALPNGSLSPSPSPSRPFASDVLYGRLSGAQPVAEDDPAGVFEGLDAFSEAGKSSVAAALGVTSGAAYGTALDRHSGDDEWDAATQFSYVSRSPSARARSEIVEQQPGSKRRPLQATRAASRVAVGKAIVAGGRTYVKVQPKPPDLRHMTLF